VGTNDLLKISKEREKSKSLFFVCENEKELFLSIHAGYPHAYLDCGFREKSTLQQ